MESRNPDLLQEIESGISPAVIREAARLIGETEQGVRAALYRCAPTVLAAFARCIARSGNADPLRDPLERVRSSRDLGGDFAELLNKVDSVRPIGQQMLRSVLGHQLDWTQVLIAGPANIRPSSALALMSLVTVALVNALDRLAESYRLDSLDLARLVLERRDVVDLVPQSITTMLELRRIPGPELLERARPLRRALAAQSVSSGSDAAAEPEAPVVVDPRAARAAVRSRPRQKPVKMSAALAASVALVLAVAILGAKAGVRLAGDPRPASSRDRSTPLAGGAREGSAGSRGSVQAATLGAGEPLEAPAIAALAKGVGLGSPSRFALEVGPLPGAPDAERMALRLRALGYPAEAVREEAGNALYSIELPAPSDGREQEALIVALRREGVGPAALQPGDPATIRVADGLPLRAAAPLAARLMERGLGPRLVATRGDAVAHVVRHGSFGTRQEAESRRDDLSRAGIPADVVALN